MGKKEFDKTAEPKIEKEKTTIVEKAKRTKIGKKKAKKAQKRTATAKACTQQEKKRHTLRYQ